MNLSDYKPDSPCIQVCRIDESTGLCEGCLRTLAEISCWWSLNAKDRAEVRELIEFRKQLLGRNSPGQAQK